MSRGQPILPAIGGGVHVTGLGGSDSALTAVVESSRPTGELALRITAPIDPEGLEPLAEVELEYFRHGQLVHLKTAVERVRSRPDGHGGTVWLVELASPEGANAIRRRRFARLPVALPLRFVRVAAPEDYDETSLRGRWMLGRWARRLQGEAEEAWVGMLGAGGVRIDGPSALHLGDSLLMELNLRGEAVRLCAKVVWLSAAEGEPGAGLEFFGVGVDKRNTINRYVLVEQAVRRRSGAWRA
jgi:Tfp pilus assembly protein PilZ